MSPCPSQHHQDLRQEQRHPRRRPAINRIFERSAPEPDAASPEAAWRNGEQEAAKGDFLAALRWLERAVRLAPKDPRIALDLANIRLQAGGAVQFNRAVADFEALTARHDVAACWLGLVAARRLCNDHAGAAAALSALLSRHCVPADQGFAEVATAVALAAGLSGWCGIDAAGLLHIAAQDGVAVSLDGVAAALSHLAPAPEQGVLAVQLNGDLAVQLNGDLAVQLNGDLAVQLNGDLAVQRHRENLLGSPLMPAAMRRCEGIVETLGATLHGWVSRPAAPDTPPKLVLMDANGRQRNILMAGILPADADAPLTIRYGFHCPVAMLAGLAPPYRITGPDGAQLFGSPIDPRAELAVTPMPATYLGPANQIVPLPAPLRVVIPVYRGLAVTQACLQSVLLALPADARLIVVDDASPEPELAAWLDDFSRDSRVSLLRHATNMGFPAAANAGLQAAQGCDVLLLNSDTLLPPSALQTLRDAAYSRPDIGSVTPFSNEATICSYPGREGGNAAPDLAGAIALNAMAAAANADQLVEIPTGIGFCLLMRHDCLAKTGLLRPEIFAQGYGEEVDWCLRARHRGYRHFAATGAYVAHLSGVSFGAAGQALNRRNARILLRLHPAYEKLVESHLQSDPLAPARRRLDALRFAAHASNSAVLLISHNHGGGVARRIAFEMQQIRAAGGRPILLRPAIQDSAATHPYPAELTDGAHSDYPNLRFTLPGDAPLLLNILQSERISHAVLHHGLGHHSDLRMIAARLGVPQDIVIHDYASFCPRVHLIGTENRYCGEPNIQACIACIERAGDETAEGLGPEKLLARSMREFAAARRIYAPSADVSRRITRHFPETTPTVTPWEDDAIPQSLKPPLGSPLGSLAAKHRRIAIIGGIGLAKGYDILLACAKDAGIRNLPLDFVIAGASADDERLLQTGRIFVTGAYRQADLPDLLGDLNADLAFIPSIWPETWCFTLSEAWAAGLYTLAFDLGAQAERIRATGRGGLLPLGLSAPRINDALLNWYPRAKAQSL